MRSFAPTLLLLVGCASLSTPTQPIPPQWLTKTSAVHVRSVSIENGNVVTSPEERPKRQSDGPIRSDGTRLYNGMKAITEPFPAIDSFDYNEARGEVVFSAKRESGFDIGLVSSDGGQVNWFPAEAADETDVQWAPRGNKVSYIVHAPTADLVRTVHIPTSFQVSAEFPYGRVYDVAWDAQGEHIAVAWSSPDASDRVDYMQYSGKERRTVVAPQARLDVEIEPLGNGAIALRPKDLHYGERISPVVWLEPGRQWNDEVGRLMGEARVTCVLAPRQNDEIWRTIELTSWMDREHSFVVGEVGPPDAYAVVGDPSLPDGRYRVAAGVVAVAPRVVQSVAAGFIADLLKRTTSTNGSSR